MDKDRQKQLRELNGLITCPECEGDGYVEVITNLTWTGVVSTKRVTCEVCTGSGYAEASDEPA